MNVWAISDLHLSYARPDRRDRYADRWRDHSGRIEAAWREDVGRRDLVLLPGDVSSARNHRDLQPDLNRLERLPGRKVLAPGNHDGWWNDLAKIRAMMRPSLVAVEGTAEAVGGVVVAGARSIPVPHRDDEETSASRAAMERALAGLDAALDAASALRGDPATPLILLWHHPPFDPHGHAGPWVERFHEAGVTHCLYGHLHTQAQWSTAVQGTRDGVYYLCVAADAIGFRPIRVPIA
ncbi:metallophosphoesterase [Paludisphaera sp.]|uniref:metallophosphoesterase n=1 Tax=Paludisphaera sp. TaxID=2017432 RepID=UPI00301D3526